MIKIFIDSCVECKFFIACPLLVGIDISHSETCSVNLLSGGPAAIKTIQIDLCDGIEMLYNKNAMENDSKIYHAGVKNFKVVHLTFDHVIPRSLGGKTTWDNVVTSCRRCNTFKGNKLVNKTNLKLNKQPYIPNNYELKEIGKLFPPNFLHKSWNDFLYWDSELEP